MTERHRFIKALNREPITGRVPTFELVFYLTMEVFGKVHPWHRNYTQWDQMKSEERELHREDMAELYIQIAEKFEWSAIYLGINPNRLEEQKRIIELIRKKSGDKYCLLLPGDVTLSLPGGDKLVEFSYKLADEPDKIKDDQERQIEWILGEAKELKKSGGLDGYCLCCDYCFNTGPFLSPDQFAEFVTPYLKKLVKGYRDLGFYTIKHTDGNIMPILDQLIEANPHAIHSIDPQAGVDIAKVKKLYGDKVCLVGNVDCGLMDTGTEAQAIESARYALKHGMPGGGYIFSTSNCVYTGMELKKYELIQDVWRKEGNYK